MGVGRWLKVAVSPPFIITDSYTNLLHRNVVRKANALILQFFGTEHHFLTIGRYNTKYTTFS